MSAVSVEGSVSQNPRRLTKRRSKGKMSISPVARAERSVRPSLRNSLVVPEETIFEEAPQSVVAIGGVRLKAGEPAWMREVGKADVFTRGVVTSIESRTECVVTTDGGAQLTKKAADLYPANAPSDAAPDHCALIHLSEPCILDNSRVRYERNDIYTFTGRILVALNPFQSLPIYGDAMMKRFSAKSDGKEAEPHVYAIGELAYARMRRTGGSQAVVMSGESGAGKTETTKHLMRYLTQRASRASELEAISTVILQANPITEAFGNAKTQRNNNSSRFGKFIKIHFGQHGAVTGASLTTYLLERSRVTQMASDERSYHIFYQARRHPRATRAPAAAAAAAAAASLPLPHPLTPAPPRAQLVAGADKTTKKEFKLDGKGAKDFASLSGGGATAIDGVDDKATYQETAGALGLAGLDAEETHALMKLLAGVLHAGTIAFDADADGNGVVAKKAEAAGSAAKELLGVPKLMHYLTERLITAGSGSMFTKQLTPAECGRARDALVRTVYARAFDWLVGRINTFVGGKHDADELAKQHYVGLLDIFGFERFAHNGFEQLCINYANEKLQQLFLGCVFKAEAEIHRAEGVPWKLIDFSDNQARRGAATPSTHPSPPTPARPPPPALPSPSPSPVRPPPRRGAST